MCWSRESTHMCWAGSTLEQGLWKMAASSSQSKHTTIFLFSFDYALAHATPSLYCPPSCLMDSCDPPTVHFRCFLAAGSSSVKALPRLYSLHPRSLYDRTGSRPWAQHYYIVCEQHSLFSLTFDLHCFLVGKNDPPVNTAVLSEVYMLSSGLWKYTKAARNLYF